MSGVTDRLRIRKKKGEEGRSDYTVVRADST